MVTGHDHPIHIQAAIVRWSRGHEFGLEFEVISPIEWTHLQDFVKEMELEPYQRAQEQAD